MVWWWCGGVVVWWCGGGDVVWCGGGDGRRRRRRMNRSYTVYYMYVCT
jgi:hypothetical protein